MARRCAKENCNNVTSKTHDRYYCNKCYREYARLYYIKHREEVLRKRLERYRASKANGN